MNKQGIQKRDIERRVACTAAAACLAVCAQVSLGASSANGQDCANLGEVALVARALAEEKIDKPRAHSILRRIYEISDAQARDLAHLVVESAYRDNSPAGEFAIKFETVCMVNSGDIESLLNQRAREARRPRSM